MKRVSDPTAALLSQLAEHIRAQGVTTVARRAGMPQGHVSRAISGRHAMTLATFARLCIASGLRVRLAAS